jgi:hypothetical protein
MTKYFIDFVVDQLLESLLLLQLGQVRLRRLLAHEKVAVVEYSVCVPTGQRRSQARRFVLKSALKRVLHDRTRIV